jgi:thiol-disulfide isomerase/thioredoxin
MKNINLLKLINFLFAAILLTACQSVKPKLNEGLWRGAFILTDQEIPFVFEVKGTNTDSTIVYLINGAERFPLKNITYSNDSVTIPIDLYDAVLTGKMEGNTINGRFKKLTTAKPDEGIPFKATFGNAPRFAASTEAPTVSLSGTWDITFINADQNEQTVGTFEQSGNLLTGSILTNGGDYRYLEGAVQGNKFQLSAFSGNSPYLAKGEFSSDSTFTGEFATAKHSTKIEGKRNPKAALADPYSFSKLKDGYTSVEFTFPDLNGNKVSLSDPKFKDKVVIVSILGSWCPNCLDETAYLSPWYKANKDRGVEIIGLAFERKNDFDFAKRTLSRLKERFDIRYDILFAGQSGTESASKALPALNGISAFPTTIFIDKKGKVRKVHTGFSGPATGKFYEEFKTDFNKLIDSLLAEK